MRIPWRLGAAIVFGAFAFLVSAEVIGVLRLGCQARGPSAGLCTLSLQDTFGRLFAEVVAGLLAAGCVTIGFSLWPQRTRTGLFGLTNKMRGSLRTRRWRLLVTGAAVLILIAAVLLEYWRGLS